MTSRNPTHSERNITSTTKPTPHTPPPAVTSVWFTDKLYRDLMFGLVLILVFGFWLVTTPYLSRQGQLFLAVPVVWGIAGVLPFPVAAFMRWQDIHRPGWLMSEADRDVEHARAIEACETRPDLRVVEDRDATLDEARAIWPTLYRWPSLHAWIWRHSSPDYA